MLSKDMISRRYTFASNIDQNVKKLMPHKVVLYPQNLITLIVYLRSRQQTFHVLARFSMFLTTTDPELTTSQ